MLARFKCCRFHPRRCGSIYGKPQTICRCFDCQVAIAWAFSMARSGKTSCGTPLCQARASASFSASCNKCSWAWKVPLNSRNSWL